MIIEVVINNTYVFSNEVVLSFTPDMRSKKFEPNIYTEGPHKILKAVGMYGPNNVGKTCLIKAISEFKKVLLNKRVSIRSNIFDQKNNISTMKITFLHQEQEFSFEFKYDTDSKEYVYEKFCEIKTDQYNNKTEKIKLLRDVRNKEFSVENEELEKLLPIMAKNNILIYLIDTDEFKEMKEIKQVLRGFANKIDIIDMNNIPNQKTIDLLKNADAIQDKVVNFIKNADVYLDDYKYTENIPFTIKAIEESADEGAQEKVLDIPEKLMDKFKLTSVYKGIPVPSMLFDSTGTKKIAALASYIIEALEQGKILVVDELDSSIHFKLTRAIVAMFNNELNKNAQLLFTVHDINLMDCKKLFRKDQIWFIHKDEEVYMYSLADFTAEKDGIRDTTDIIEKYRKGALGALPEPNMINSLLEVRHE
ncbi:MAG: AAA family ATPase [Cellulosilyticaceae bacterium]